MHKVTLWDAIERLSGQVNAFDFEGSMIEPIERFFEVFGAAQTPYFHISRTSTAKGALIQFAQALKSKWRKRKSGK